MPKIMVLGAKGAGITTQINMICDRYKLDSLDLKAEFLKTMKAEKEVRKRSRLLARGFRPAPEADDEGVVPADPEIEEDPEDFSLE
jgi:ABC-type multidrug transport system ATPase subunit